MRVLDEAPSRRHGPTIRRTPATKTYLSGNDCTDRSLLPGCASHWARPVRHLMHSQKPRLALSLSDKSQQQRPICAVIAAQIGPCCRCASGARRDCERHA